MTVIVPRHIAEVNPSLESVLAKPSPIRLSTTMGKYAILRSESLPSHVLAKSAIIMIEDTALRITETRAKYGRRIALIRGRM